MPEPRFELVGCVIEDQNRSGKWSVVAHGSHGGLVRGNVILGGDAAGIVTEDGSESYNTIEDNLVLDVNEDAYWINGARNYFRNNTAACCGSQLAGAAFYLPPNLDANATHTVPTPEGGTETFRHVEQTFLEFRDNEAYSCRAGFYLDHRSPAATHLLTNPRVWSCWGNDANAVTPSWGIAVAPYDSGTVIVEGLVSRGASVDIYSGRELRLINCDVQLAQYGVHDRSHNGRILIEGGLYCNRVNLAPLLSPSAGAGPLPQGPIKTTLIKGVQTAAPPGMTHYALAMYAELDQPSRIPVAGNVLHVEDCLGLTGRHRVYWAVQAAGEAVPFEGDISDAGGFAKVGCPERGLSNAEALAAWEWRPDPAADGKTAEYRRRQQESQQNIPNGNPFTEEPGWQPVAWGGAVAPEGVVIVPGIVGLVDPAAEAP
jgi:hypothetical protein